MRGIGDTLLAYQKKPSVDPLYKIVLTHGETTYTYGVERILSIDHEEGEDWQRARVVLDNAGGTLKDIAFKGYQGVISYGMVTSEGDEYSPTAPLKVIAQQLPTAPGVLQCMLSLVGYPNLIGEDKANDKYTVDVDDTKTVKTHIRELMGDSGASLISVYDHCDSYDVVFDSEDSLIDSYQPKDGYSIHEGTSRGAKLQWLLRLTGCVSRWEDDGKLHIFVPTTSGSSYDSEYSMARGEHTFFSKTYRKRLVIPNYIVVRSLISQETAYEGSAEDTDSSDLYENRAYYRYRVSSNDECDDLAASLLAHYQMDAEKGSGEIPMNVGAEIWDYVNIAAMTDKDNSRAGNLRYIRRRCGKGRFDMSFRFGALFPSGLGAAGLDGNGGGGGGGGGGTTQEILDYLDLMMELLGFLATRTILFGVQGTLTETDNASYEIIVPENLVCERVYINVKTRPTGCQLIVDVNLDGTTIFSTQTNRPKIAAGLTVAESGKPDTVVFNKNQKLSIDIDQVGSDDPGEDLTVQLRCRLRGF